MMGCSNTNLKLIILSRHFTYFFICGGFGGNGKIDVVQNKKIPWMRA